MRVEADGAEYESHASVVDLRFRYPKWVLCRVWLGLRLLINFLFIFR